MVSFLTSMGTTHGATPLLETGRLVTIAKRVETGCRQVEEGLASPNPQPPVRQLTPAALGLLELGESPDRAEKLVSHAFGLQDIDTASPGYGTVPWQEGHPKIKDPNAIEFTMQPAVVILFNLVLNGNQVDTSKPFEFAANADAVVGIREGKSVVAIRLFAVDGCAGQSPTWKLEFDGNEPGAGRLAVHHYRGLAQSLAEQNIRCERMLLAERCETESEFATFLNRVSQIKLADTTRKGIWHVKAKSGSVELEASLDLSNKLIALSRVNGRAWKPEVLEPV